MKPEKMSKIAQQIGGVIDVAIEFGKSIQIHDDAHAKMMYDQQELQTRVAALQVALAETSKPSKLN